MGLGSACASHDSNPNFHFLPYYYCRKYYYCQLLRLLLYTSTRDRKRCLRMPAAW